MVIPVVVGPSSISHPTEFFIHYKRLGACFVSPGRFWEGIAVSKRLISNSF